MCRFLCVENSTKNLSDSFPSSIENGCAPVCVYIFFSSGRDLYMINLREKSLKSFFVSSPLYCNELLLVKITTLNKVHECSSRIVVGRNHTHQFLQRLITVFFFSFFDTNVFVRPKCITSFQIMKRCAAICEMNEMRNEIK